MQIYTSGLSEYNYRNACKFYPKIGAMVSPSDCVRSLYSCVPIAVDNGAWSAFVNGKDFSDVNFYKILDGIEKKFIYPNFVVLPDIVCGGNKSLLLSEKYMFDLRRFNLALAVQDGMPIDCISVYRNNITHVFVGGSFKWKWETAKDWVDYSHKIGLKCHIARCGTIDKLRYAQSIGADSVDSSSWTRGDNWYHLSELFKPTQEVLGYDY